MVKDLRELSGGIYLTALVIGYSLFAPRPANTGFTHNFSTEHASGNTIVTAQNVRFLLGNLGGAINAQGELRLLFPGCLSAAAPFLLFRLKREGFSDCRAEVTGEGVLLRASR